MSSTHKKCFQLSPSWWPLKVNGHSMQCMQQTQVTKPHKKVSQKPFHTDRHFSHNLEKQNPTRQIVHMPKRFCWTVVTLAKNITNCVITIYITLHYQYFTLHFGAFLRFFLHIHVHNFLVLYDLSPSLPEGLSRWQLLELLWNTWVWWE